MWKKKGLLCRVDIEKRVAATSPVKVSEVMGLCPIHIVCVRYYQAILLTEASEASVCCSGINKILYKECTCYLRESSGMDMLQLS